MEPASYPDKSLMEDDNNPNNAPAKCATRGQWANKREFILAVVGSIIGLGNVWRFSYLCFKNGGGVFLIPYVLILITCGIPLFFLELSLGQLTSQGGITCWRKICPLFEGLGYGSLIIMLYGAMYYIVILAWAFLYLFSSFHAVLPWSSCNNTWNTGTHLHYVGAMTSMATNTCSLEEEESSAFVCRNRGDRQYPLGPGWIPSAKLDPLFCVWKGVKTSGKVVYFTATFPYMMLIVLLIRGLTLPGAADGIKYYLSPDLTLLTNPRIWMDAGSQILFSTTVCSGSLTSLGSYNKYNNNCYKDTFGMCILNSLTSLIAGFAVFSVLGFMSYELGVDISMVAESGPGLAFIAYPRGVAMMPLPQLWAALFFIMLIFLGLDSGFVLLEGLVTSISDMHPSFFFTGHRRKLLLLAICVVSLVIGLFMVMEGRLYIFMLFDYYACNGMPIMLFGILESICVGWIFGADCYYDKIKDMIGYSPPSYMKYCWKFFTPFVCTGILLFSLLKFTPLRYNTYQYPWWGYAIGIGLACSSVILTPLWMIYSMAVTPGTVRQRLKMLCTPTADLRNSSPKKTLYSDAPFSDTELRDLMENPKDGGSEGVPPII